MARPYANEMAELSGTLEAVASMDIAAFRDTVQYGLSSPMMAIGSGGSFSAAFGLAFLHRYFARRAAFVSTPLEASAEPLDRAVIPWLISAGGRNVDINATAKALIQREPRLISVLTARKISPLINLCNEDPFCRAFVSKPPGGKDGFLATNSLLGFFALSARAYCEAVGHQDLWERAFDRAAQYLSTPDCPDVSCDVWQRSTTLILHGSETKLGAVDLESKFTEAALGNLQIADFRNFAHGRHHWLAKRGESSAVIAFSTDRDRKLANKTLALLPQSVPLHHIRLEGGHVDCSLISLLTAFKIVQQAGAARGIDPGQPGVPEFGRKLYSLKLPAPISFKPPKGRSQSDVVAISRKVGESPEHSLLRGDLREWLSSLDTFKAKLKKANFRAVVLDYDGTIVDTSKRFFPPQKAISEELIRVLESCTLGFATGRGQSLRTDLRAAIPPRLWKKIFIGYYNGSVIAPLTDDAVPKQSDTALEDLAIVAEHLDADLWFNSATERDDRETQISLSCRPGTDPADLWVRVNGLLPGELRSKLKILRSGHSVDLVSKDTSKLDLITYLKKQLNLAGDQILTIGDRGLWPGNDYELLSHEYSLSVDEVSSVRNSCWALAPAGIRGPLATIHYLQHLESNKTGIRFVEGAL